MAENGGMKKALALVLRGESSSVNDDLQPQALRHISQDHWTDTSDAVISIMNLDESKGSQIERRRERS